MPRLETEADIRPLPDGEVIDLTIGQTTVRERLVKSAARVRDIGEVFTPAETVAEMLALIPGAMWEPHRSATFLEPACGDGNFLVAILQRKLDRIAAAHAAGALPAGDTDSAAQFHALEAIAAIYAVDISAENIIGGTPGHGVGARDRMLAVFADWHYHTLGSRLAARSIVRASAQWVVDHNIQVGNMLPFSADGTPSRRDSLPLVAYDWDPSTLIVSVSRTTMGAVTAAGNAETTGVVSLFADLSTPTVEWSGPAYELRTAPIDAPAVPHGPAQNGNGRARR